jgi:hypothetical protein
MESMKHLRILGVALVAVFALVAVTAASASAASEPEYKACVKLKKNAEKKYTGGFNDKRCTEVNGAGEGKYAAEEVKAPIEFTGKSKASTLYYYVPGGAILYTVTCKKDKVTGTIESAKEIGGGLGLGITFESCEAMNLSTKVKAKCATAPSVEPGGIALLDLTLPAEAPGLGVQARISAFECGTTKFERMFPLLEAEVLPTSKGEFAVFKVNKATGESIPRELLFEGSPVAVESTGEVVEGATHYSVEVGLEGTDPIAPKKEVVVIP